MRTETKTIIEALRILAGDIFSEDGIANLAIAEAADRMEELSDEVLFQEQMKQKAEGYLQDYLDALKRIDDLAADRDEAVRSCHIWQKGHSDIVADRDLWKAEAERWKTISQTQTTQYYAYPN